MRDGIDGVYFLRLSYSSSASNLLDSPAAAYALEPPKALHNSGQCSSLSQVQTFLGSSGIQTPWFSEIKFRTGEKEPLSPDQEVGKK